MSFFKKPQQLKTIAPLETTRNVEAIFDTNMGTIRVKLFVDKAPNTTTNFIQLAEGTTSWKNPAGTDETRPFYDGLVFRLVCQGADAPVAIASGGRYDALVGRFDIDGSRAAGTGFAFAIEAIRELLDAGGAAATLQGPWLVAAAPGTDPARCLSRQADHHRRAEAAELCLQPCEDRAQAEAIARERGCCGVDWLEA